MRIIILILFVSLKAFSQNILLFEDEVVHTSLIPNSDMELNSTWSGWATEAGDSVNRSSAFAHTGTYSWRLKTDFGEGMVGGTVPLISGQVYVWSFWVKFETAGATNRIRSNPFVGNEASDYSDALITTNEWTKVTWERTATGTGSGYFWIFQSAGTKMNVYIDDVLVYKK